MILEIDAGNTRIKWRMIRAKKVVGFGVLLTECIDELGQDIEAVGVPKQLRLSNVAGEVVRVAVLALSQKWGAHLQLAETSHQAANVTCAYQDVSKMGVDRWLAVVAAYNRYQKACVVVDAGSAITVDLVDGKGQHKGGYIVPGFQMMRHSLFKGTSSVKVDRVVGSDVSPGKSTIESVNHGLLLMVTGLIANAQAQLASNSLLDQSSQRIPYTLLTGGDADLLSSVMLDSEGNKEASKTVVAPDLVMDGLVLALPDIAK